MRGVRLIDFDDLPLRLDFKPSLREREVARAAPDHVWLRIKTAPSGHSAAKITRLVMAPYLLVHLSSCSPAL